MSIAGVLPYARTRLSFLGFKEWTDGFNFKNIPKARLNETFAVELGNSFGIKNTQDSQDIDTEFTVHLFLSQTNNPRALIDNAASIADTVITDLLAAANRTTQVGIKNVRFNNMAIEPIDQSNDNGLEIKIGFTAYVVISTR